MRVMEQMFILQLLLRNDAILCVSLRRFQKLQPKTIFEWTEQHTPIRYMWEFTRKMFSCDQRPRTFVVLASECLCRRHTTLNVANGPACLFGCAFVFRLNGIASRAIHGLCDDDDDDDDPPWTKSILIMGVRTYRACVCVCVGVQGSVFRVFT